MQAPVLSAEQRGAFGATDCLDHARRLDTVNLPARHQDNAAVRSERKSARGLTEVGENCRTGRADVAATDNEDLSGAKSQMIEAYEGERPELGAYKSVNV